MATSSIKKDVVIEGKEQVNKFVEALEDSIRAKEDRVEVNAVHVIKSEEIRKFFESK